jgi:hypothetical protein
MTDPENGAVPPVPPPAAPVAPPTAPPVTPPTAPTAGGYTAPPPAYSAMGVTAPKKTLSLIGMIAGIVGLLGFWIVFFPIVGSILQLFIPGAALVLGILGRKREGLPARGFWLTAIITGVVGLVIAVIALIGWIAIFAIGNANGLFTTNRY